MGRIRRQSKKEKVESQREPEEPKGTDLFGTPWPKKNLEKKLNF